MKIICLSALLFWSDHVTAQVSDSLQYAFLQSSVAAYYEQDGSSLKLMDKNKWSSYLQKQHDLPKGVRIANFPFLSGCRVTAAQAKKLRKARGISRFNVIAHQADTVDIEVSYTPYLIYRKKISFWHSLYFADEDNMAPCGQFKGNLPDHSPIVYRRYIFSRACYCWTF